MSTIDQQFVEFIVKSLVSKPDDVKIERRIDEKGVLLELTVDAEDLGRVIGKRGATAQSLRTLLRALGTKNEARYNLKIVDTSDGEPIGRPTRPARSQDESGSRDSDSQSAADDTSTDNSSDVPDKPAEKDSDVVSKTRKELEDLDDLDI
jgi:uncharacterized protein